jgi:hypothetical protein
MRVQRLGLIVAALAVVFGFVLFWQTIPLAHALPLKTAAGEAADKNYLTYTNADFDFTLTYPSDLSVQEYDEGEGTRSVVFQNANEQAGFEMFITSR